MNAFNKIQKSLRVAVNNCEISQFKSAHLFENIFTILSEPQFLNMQIMNQNSVRHWFIQPL